MIQSNKYMFGKNIRIYVRILCYSNKTVGPSFTIDVTDLLLANN